MIAQIAHIFITSQIFFSRPPSAYNFPLRGGRNFIVGLPLTINAPAAFFRVRWFLEFRPPILRPPESPAVIDFPNSRGFQFPAGNVRIPERRRRRRRPKNSRARRGAVRRGRARIPEYYGKGAGRPAPHGGAGKAFCRPPVRIRRVRANAPARRPPVRLVRCCAPLLFAGGHSLAAHPLRLLNFRRDIRVQIVVAHYHNQGIVCRVD